MTPATTSDPIWGDYRPGFFDPVPLHRLAQFMRDGSWLEMQTEDGKLTRVRITEIRVYVSGEDVVLRQEWLDDEEEFHHREIVVESDAIWRAWPIKMPLGKVPPPPHVPRSGDPVTVFGHVLNVLIADTGFTTGELTVVGDGRQPPGLTDARHSGIVLLYEMTDESPTWAAGCFGYKSQQPLLTARSKMGARASHYHDFVQDTRRRAKLVWKRLGFEARRQTPGHKSVL